MGPHFRIVKKESLRRDESVCFQTCFEYSHLEVSLESQVNVFLTGVQVGCCSHVGQVAEGDPLGWALSGGRRRRRRWPWGRPGARQVLEAVGAALRGGGRRGRWGRPRRGGAVRGGRQHRHGGQGLLRPQLGSAVVKVVRPCSSAQTSRGPVVAVGWAVANCKATVFSS